MPGNAGVLARNIRRNDESRGQGSATPEVLIRDARRILDACGVAMPQARLSRLVRTYKHQVESNGFDFAVFLMNAVHLSRERQTQLLHSEDLARAIAYADPVGEQAVRNVERERGY